MKKNSTSTLSGILLGISVILIVCALATFLLTHVDWIYRIDMKALDIPSYSGYTDKEMILRNYHEAVAFITRVFSNERFVLPDLAVSEVGAVHFADCRNIVRGLYLAAVIALPIAIPLFVRNRENRKKLCRSAGITILAVPAVVLIGILIDPDKFFILFHKIFFSNDYWLFDWYEDEVIRILPEFFFIHCAIFIVLMWIIAAVALLFLSKEKKQNC